jgi:outer membrane receptor protein involved in Fe transport
MNQKITVVITAAVSAWLTIFNPAATAQEAPTAPPLDEVVVIGSRIPRIQTQGAAPITTISADEISAQGLTSVPDLLKVITQNSGATQSQQSFSGSDFTPGAEQVDLRGLGPNHTLVLINGRRIADFPLPLDGLSNFTDISNIPIGMIDKVEVLSGSASAIYGSDAMAGVVNFVLKKNIEGVDFSYRYGTPTEDGGGDSHRLSMSAGLSRDRFHATFGLELLDQRPLWAFDRKIQDSTADNPTTDAPIARRDFLRIEPNDEVYIDPGQATCASLSDLNKGTIGWGTRPGWGPFDDELDDWGDGHFCGSEESIGYGTVLNSRRGATGFASLNYDLSDNTTLFADILVGVSKVETFKDVQSWNYQDELGNEEGTFFNDQVGDLDNWYRQFTPEEMGGLERGMIKTDQTTITITPGIKGSFGDSQWNYEAYLNHSEYKVTASWPQIVAARANAFFLGPQTGVDEDSGLATYDADPARLYTPLSQADYNSIAARTVYHPESRNDYGSFTVTNGELFNLPAGPVGFAANVEVGNQAYDLNPDPLALQYYYFSWKDQDGHGSRNHWSGSYEFRLPVVKMLEFSTAGRYDNYHFAGNDVGKFTYNFGLEFRPVDSLLVRGYYGTGFRAPDLHYVFAGVGNVESGGNDYYLCRTEEPDVDIGDCSFADIGVIAIRSGNRELEPETSTSWGAGLVWSPTDNLMVSVDYFDVKLDQQVKNLRVDSVLEVEADCRLGETSNGAAVDVNSPTCQDALARVVRYPVGSPSEGAVNTVRVNPINIANESTDGIDVAFRWKQPIGASSLTFDASYTRVFNHESQQYVGDPVVNQFDPDSGFVIPRSKASASVTFETGPFSATLHALRLDEIANWDEDGFIPASILMNLSMNYDFTEALSARLTIDNLADEMPEKDVTYASYPYYDVSWFDSVGRTVFFTIDYKFGVP